MITTFLFWAAWAAAAAQSAGQVATAYRDNMYLGNRAMEEREFEEAIKKFILARISPNAPSDGKAERRIIEALDLRVSELTAIADTIAQQRDRLKDLNDKIEKEKKEALQQRDTARIERNRADRNYRLFYSVYVADAAMQDLQKDSAELALKKAFHAYRKLDTIQVPSAVHRAFSAAVYKRYGELLISSQNAGIIAMEMAEDGQSFHVISRDTSVRRLRYQTAGVSGIKDLTGLGQFTEEVGIAEEDIILTAVALPADSALIVGGRGASIKRVAADTITALLKKSGHDGTIVRVKALPDGHLLSAGRDGKVLLWSPEGEEVCTIVEDAAPIADLQLSEDGSSVLIRTMRSLYHWKPGGGADKARRLDDAGDELVIAAVLSADGAQILSSYSDGQVMLWGQNGLLKAFREEYPAFVVAFTSAGAELLVALQNGDIIRYTHQGGSSWIRKELYAHPGVNRLIQGKGQSSFLSIGSGNDAILYLPQDKVIRLSGHQGPVLSAAFSPRPEDQAVVSASMDHTLKMWSAKGVLLMDIDLGAPVTDVMFTPDGHYILAGTSRGTVHTLPSPLYVRAQLQQAQASGSGFDTAAVAEQLGREIDQLLGKE